MALRPRLSPGLPLSNEMAFGNETSLDNTKPVKTKSKKFFSSSSAAWQSWSLG
jgi:hypothetical protein